MKYERIVRGQIDKRINRFIGEVYIDGVKERVHIKNTGRLKELFQPGAEVLLEGANNPNRKTKFSLIAVLKEDVWVNIDSQAPNAVAFEAIEGGKIAEIGTVDFLKREVTYGASRFDLYFEKGDHQGFIEVKGVTLEKEGIAMFPDAPTTRGTKHVLELVKAAGEGYKCAILFVVQLKGCQKFIPNRETDPAFTDALLQAAEAGVQILAYDTVVEEGGMVLIMSVYNIALQGFSTFTVGSVALLFGITYIVAFIIESLVEPQARKLAFSLRYDKSKKINVIVVFALCMVPMMVLIMSAYGLAFKAFTIGLEGSIFIEYLQTVGLNFIVALPAQLLIVGPISRWMLVKYIKPAMQTNTEFNM